MMPRRRDRNAASLAPLPDSLDACRSLPSDVLALHLEHHHLYHSGSRSARGARLWAHTQPDSHDEEGESEIEGHGDDHSETDAEGDSAASEGSASDDHDPEGTPGSSVPSDESPSRYQLTSPPTEPHPVLDTVPAGVNDPTRGGAPPKPVDIGTDAVPPVAIGH